MTDDSTRQAVADLNKRFRKFVRLTMEIQDNLQKSLEESILKVIPNIPFMSIKDDVQEEMKKSKKLLAEWRRKVNDEVL